MSTMSTVKPNISTRPTISSGYFTNTLGISDERLGGITHKITHKPTNNRGL